jgi:hypothetical protein
MNPRRSSHVSLRAALNDESVDGPICGQTRLEVVDGETVIVSG